VPRNVHTYDHFCVLARTLEQVGDRWTLLVVRDLIAGAKRFTDLMNRLGGITPKTLTQRLRELEDAGIVAVERTPGRREVFYRLTPSGAELAPAIRALTGWGLRHASRPPRPGEPIHPEHVLGAITQFLDRSADDDAPARWHFRFHGDGDYLIESDGEGWSLASSAPCDEPDVTVTTDRYAWLRFVLVPALNRAPEVGVDITGNPQAIVRFERLLQAFSSSATAPSLHQLREKLPL
jgi:DNA-binding HxlR family transcriptional regulator